MWSRGWVLKNTQTDVVLCGHRHHAWQCHLIGWHWLLHVEASAQALLQCWCWTPLYMWTIMIKCLMKCYASLEGVDGLRDCNMKCNPKTYIENEVSPMELMRQTWTYGAVLYQNHPENIYIYIFHWTCYKTDCTVLYQNHYQEEDIDFCWFHWSNVYGTVL